MKCDQIPQNSHYPTNYFKFGLYGYYIIRHLTDTNFQIVSVTT